jgi:hypothetical protein
MKEIYASESIKVIESIDNDGDVQRQLYLGPPFNHTQGGIKMSRPDFHVHEFTRNLSYGALCVAGGVRNALFLGLGAGVAVQAVRAFFPEANIDIVDINLELFEVSHRYFFNIESDNVKLFHEDAYSFIQRASKKYDYICCDIWTHSLDVPNYIFFDEFSALAKNCLTGNGIFSINTQKAIYKNIAESLIKQFRFILSLQGYNCSLLSTNNWPDFPTGAGVAAELLAKNMNIESIHDNLILLQPVKSSGLVRPNPA